MEKQVRNKNILHFIDSLGVGGAERVVVNNVKLFTDYNHILCVLSEPEDLRVEIPEDVTFINLNFSGQSRIFSTMTKYRKVLKDYNIDIVHAHLFKSSWVARIARRKNIPLVTTIHSETTLDPFSINKWSRVIEQLTISRVDHLIGVSNTAMQDYKKNIRNTVSSTVIYNYSNISNITLHTAGRTDKLRVLCVGTLKAQKNYPFLLKALGLLSETYKKEVQVDIYGSGSLEKMLNDQIMALRAPIELKGLVRDITHVYGAYDIFCMASLYEGLPMVILEASCAGLPMLLSDIPIFRELTTPKNALYFNLNNPLELTQRIMDIVDGKVDLESMGKHSRMFYDEINNVDIYIQKHYNIYQSLLK